VHCGVAASCGARGLGSDLSCAIGERHRRECDFGWTFSQCRGQARSRHRQLSPEYGRCRRHSEPAVHTADPRCGAARMHRSRRARYVGQSGCDQYQALDRHRCRSNRDAAEARGPLRRKNRCVRPNRVFPAASAAIDPSLIVASLLNLRQVFNHASVPTFL
jgi:hypothetical protein